MNTKIDPGINFLEKSPEKLPYIYKQHSSNLPFQRERNLQCLIKEIPIVNKSSQDTRRVGKPALISENKGKTKT